MKLFLCFIIFYANTLLAVPHDLSELHRPFWKNKPQAYKKIKDNEILVSAFTDKISKEPLMYQMKVVAGGGIAVPLEDTFSIIRDYETLSQVDSRFRQVLYNKNESKLYLHMEALGYHAKMHLKLKEVVTQSTKQIHWECVEGSFKGMRGVIVLEALDENQTEISMTSDYKAEKLPLPKVLMGLGLEVIGRQVAKKMQEFIVTKHARK